MIKIDLSDGFYRVPIKAEDVPRLGVVLPKKAVQPTNIAFPVTLPMGWAESPPFFCATTETVVDLANDWLHHWDPPKHPLEDVAATLPELIPGHHMITQPPPKKGNRGTIVPPRRKYQRRKHRFLLL